MATHRPEVISVTGKQVRAGDGTELRDRGIELLMVLDDEGFLSSGEPKERDGDTCDRSASMRASFE